MVGRKKMYPIKFKPIYKERIWGGTNLTAVFGRKISGDHIGESWELSSHSNGTSIVENGYLAGKNLNELITEYKEQLMGKKFANDKYFPLLIKILDANDNLSIQVHPDDEYAHRVEGEAGKTEAWYVIHAKENAHIIYGLKNNITKEDFNKAIENNKIDDAVKRVPVKAGDMIFVPAGMIHALLDGVMVYEVQQNSDTTYRVYDYDRVGDDGKKRELHIEKALEVIDFTEQPSCIFTGNSINCQYFSMEKLSIAGEKHEMTKEQFIIYCVIAGSGEIQYKESIVCLSPGDTVLIPACLGEFILKGNIDLLKIR
jgi:mannose-6-phosphate isomerase